MTKTELKTIVQSVLTRLHDTDVVTTPANCPDAPGMSRRDLLGKLSGVLVGALAVKTMGCGACNDFPCTDSNEDASLDAGVDAGCSLDCDCTTDCDDCNDCTTDCADCPTDCSSTDCATDCPTDCPTDCSTTDCDCPFDTTTCADNPTGSSFF